MPSHVIFPAFSMQPHRVENVWHTGLQAKRELTTASNASAAATMTRGQRVAGPWENAVQEEHSYQALNRIVK